MSLSDYNFTVAFRRILLLAGLVFACNSYNAQIPLDSLLQKVSYQKEDTTKAKLYYDIARSYFSRDRSMYKIYTDSMFRLSKKLKYGNGLGLAYAAYAFYYSLDNDWEKVKYNLQKSDSVYEKIGKTVNIMRNKELYSAYYKYVGDYNKALQTDLVLLQYYERNGPKTSEAKMLGALALILKELERYKEADVYYKKSIQLRKELNDIPGLSVVLLNYGGTLAERGLFKRAEPYLNEALELQKKINNQENIAVCKSGLGHIYAETGRPEKALRFINESREFFQKYDDTINIIKLTLYESIAYMKLEKYKDAIEVLNAQHHLIRNKKPYRELEAALLWQYYRVYKAMGKTDVALEYLEESRELEDLSRNMHIQHGVSQAKERYETNKKQQENEQLRKDNELKDLQITQRNYFMYGSVLLLLLISIIAFTTVRYNRLKNEKIAVEMEQRLLQTQMNPHFIFNVLHAIHTFMLKKDTDESGRLLTSFARLVRSILQHSSTDSISLEQELNWLKDYMGLQQLRFNYAFNYSIEIDEALSPDNVLLPPMLIQPFIENAIEHGFSGLDKAGELKISYLKSGNEVEIQIVDNGKGFSNDELIGKAKNGHESIAIQITEKRISLLNKKRKGSFIFRIASTPNEGTTVLFTIPYNSRFD